MRSFPCCSNSDLPALSSPALYLLWLLSYLPSQCTYQKKMSKPNKPGSSGLLLPLLSPLSGQLYLLTDSRASLPLHPGTLGLHFRSSLFLLPSIPSPRLQFWCPLMLHSRLSCYDKGLLLYPSSLAPGEHTRSPLSKAWP